MATTVDESSINELKDGEPIIRFEHVQQSFNDNVVIPDLNLTINAGELFVLVGTSGSGKTTTLKMVNQLQPQSGGKIFIKDENITDIGLQELRWNIGYVLQQIALFPTMTVAQNIAVIPEMKGVKREEIDATIDRLLNQVGLDPKKYRDRMPSELSGGEQQRIGICRAIASEPPVVLMDEPFSALDPISRTQLQDLVLDLHEKRHDTIIFVTHDMDEALKLGDRIAVMSEGKILQVDTPTNIAQHPANQFVEAFFSQSVAHNVYDVYVGKMVMMGFSESVLPEGHTAPIDISSDKTLGEAFDDLTNCEYLRVVDGDRQLGFINAQNIVNYLSQRKRDEDENN
ncbi:ABC transporter ATP-binding protein [Furfurilactobacillus milii]|uniref:ABC-type quaternary amine transporter n=1 Tax=Furfurilactobacillus rossiae TaxID=231049 RepID=A0A7C9N5X1_9LACO|nr:ABC transporter ATP-binding protein [Furfurilactobacillus milii]MYV06149.1 ATP-binding cassette domain-containing protein [Furfurilactobacillus milii]